MSLSIANRILLGFIAILVLIVAIGLYALSQIADVRETTATIVSRDIAALRQLTQVRNDQFALRDLRATALIQLLTTSGGRPVAAGEDPIGTWEARMAESVETLQQSIAFADDLKSRALVPQRQAAWQTISERLRSAAEALRQLETAGQAQMAAVRAGDVDRALAAEAGVREAREQMLTMIAAAEDSMNAAIAAGQDRVASVYERSRTSLLVGIALTGLLGLAIAFGIRRSVVGPLSTFMDFVERVGKGELGGSPAATGRDEIGQLGTTLNAMVHGLRDLAEQSRAATEDLNAAVAEIRASTQEQAASVEEQLAAVQETAATVDEITHAGSQIGKRAQEVIASAQATAQTSMQGLEAVEETGRAMDAIREQAEAVAENIVALSEKTQAVGEIITTVNDISERSHLLALNAAIEAAAAGESGRSFAVVAAEMKLLADQAKEATTQVRSILGDIQRGINASVLLTEEAVKRVTAGKERTDVTQRTIDEITGRVQESVNTFQQIVASTNQQQLGIEQVMSALSNIRQASQQTAAGTRQLDSAAGNLAQLAQQLLGIAGRYRL